MNKFVIAAVLMLGLGACTGTVGDFSSNPYKASNPPVAGR